MGERPDSHKLFVGSLPEDCSPEELRIVFGTYGEVDHVHMMAANSRTGNRCAFVFYRTRHAAEDAIQVLNGQYKIRIDAEKAIDVRWPKSEGDKGASKGGSRGGNSWSAPVARSPKPEPNGGGWDAPPKYSPPTYSPPTHAALAVADSGAAGSGCSGAGTFAGGGDESKLFVGNLPGDITEEEIRIVFSTYGQVRDIHLMKVSPESGMRCAFVKYAARASAEDAIQVLNGQYKIREAAPQALQVRWAINRTGAGGSSLGGGGRSSDTSGRVSSNAGFDSGGSWGGGAIAKGGAGWPQPSEDGWGANGVGDGDPWAGGSSCSGGARLYVANLPEDIMKESLEYVFGTYGRVLNAHIMLQKVVKGCVSAFIEYATLHEAETAILSLNEKYEIRAGYGPIRVKHATPKGQGKGSAPY